MAERKARITHVVVANECNDAHGQRCCACPERFDVGDVVMVIDQGCGVYVDRFLGYHRRCMLAAVEVAPPEQDDLTAEMEALGRAPVSPLREILGDLVPTP